MDLIITILPVVTKDLPISPRFTLYDFLSRCKFSTLTTRQPMVEYELETLHGRAHNVSEASTFHYPEGIIVTTCPFVTPFGTRMFLKMLQRMPRAFVQKNITHCGNQRDGRLLTGLTTPVRGTPRFNEYTNTKICFSSVKCTYCYSVRTDMKHTNEVHVYTHEGE